MKFTERVLLLIINELGLEIRSVKANCSHRAGRPTSESTAGHIGSRGEFHEGMGRGEDRFLDSLRSLEMTGGASLARNDREVTLRCIAFRLP